VSSKQYFSLSLIPTGLNKDAAMCFKSFPSKRALSYESDTESMDFYRVFWECSSQVACETYPSGVSLSTHVSLRAWIRRRSRPTMNHSILLWGLISCAYSAGSLSHHSDKLIALSGVAKRFAFENGLPGSDYLPGLWRLGIV